MTGSENEISHLSDAELFRLVLDTRPAMAEAADAEEKKRLAARHGALVAELRARSDAPTSSPGDPVSPPADAPSEPTRTGTFVIPDREALATMCVAELAQGYAQVIQAAAAA
jgi:hypothetical protein